MQNATESTGKVQAILRMDADKYRALRNAARRANMSFNTYAVETLMNASGAKPVSYRREDLKPDPVLSDLTVESFGFTDEELAANPRIASILSK